MRIRPYIESRDYEKLEKWIDGERTHALWCANLVPYPMTRNSFHHYLENNAKDFADGAYVATERDEDAIGFFCYSVNDEENTGFLKFIIVDTDKRGIGCGKEMLQLALRYAFDITGVALVQLNVFDENFAAKRCYEKLGFVEDHIIKNVFPYKDELWSRCRMIIPKQQFLLHQLRHP